MRSTLQGSENFNLIKLIKFKFLVVTDVTDEETVTDWGNLRLYFKGGCEDTKMDTARSK